MLVLLLAALAAGGWLALRVGWPAWRGIQELRAAQAVAARLAPAASSGGALASRPRDADLAALEAHLAAAHDAWQEASAGLAVIRPLLGPARLVPHVGPAVAAAPDVAALVAALCGAGADLTGALRPAVAALDGGPLSERIGPVLAALRTTTARAAAAERQLAAAEAARARLDGIPLVGPLAPLEGRRAQLAQALPLARQAAHDLAVLPGPLGAALGLDGPRTYAILGQTEEERRASGGYIGSIGLVRVEGGRVVATEFRDSRDWSHPAAAPIPAPVPLAVHMGFGAWYVRDANWFASFPTSAAWLAWFLARDWGVQVDGVVALDQAAVGGLLEALGPIDLPRYGERITAANLRERTTYWLYAAPFQGERRNYVPGVKSPFVAELGQALMQRVFQLELRDLPALAARVQRLLAEKHLLVTLKEPALAELLAAQGWDGRLPATGDDLVYIVEHTASYSKVAPYVVASRAYTVTLDARGVPVEAALTLTYTNRYDAEAARALYPPYYLGTYWDSAAQREAYAEGYYAALMRVYVPRGSALVAADGWAAHLEPDEEAGRTVFGGLLTLPAGATRTVTLVYRPGPLATAPGQYRLALPKQPGTPAEPFTVTVYLPAGVRVARSDPPATLAEGLATWQGRLGTDRTFALDLHTP
jgi:hypothetical protein